MSTQTDLVAETEADPLAGAGWVYRMFEGFCLRNLPTGNGTLFSRIVFRAPAVTAVRRRDRPGARAADIPGFTIEAVGDVPFPPLEQVVGHGRVDDAASGRQQVWLARKDPAGQTFLERFALAADNAAGDEALVRTTFPLGTAAFQSVAGEAVLADGKPAVLLAGSTADGIVVGAFDVASGKLTATWPLVDSRPGTVAGSFTLARNFKTWLFITARTQQGIATVALDVRSLHGHAIAREKLHYLPVHPAAADGVINCTLGRMFPDRASQQLLIGFCDPSGAPHILMQGFDKSGPRQLALVAVDTGFAKPKRRDVSVTCADLDNNGQEELVAAFPTDYGEVSGAAAFVLFRFKDAEAPLFEADRYVAAAPKGMPLASGDLKLGSGILGDGVTSGVLVISTGADTKHILRGQAQVFAGIVPVNPVTLRFPPYSNVPDTLPSVTQIAVTKLNAARILGSVVDMIGLSVVLGAPEFSQADARGQLLAIIQVPPFDLDAVASTPLLTFTQSGSDVKGLSVSSSKDWLTSTDAGVSLGIDTATLKFEASNAYGKGFEKTEDASTTIGLEIERTPTRLDRLVTFARSYAVWRYPITRRSRGEESGGTMLVVFPTSSIPVQHTPIAYDKQFGYRTKYEPGNLLTYMNVDLDGWDETRQHELLLFKLASLEVTNDKPDKNVYDKTDSNKNTVGKSYSVASSVGTSVDLTGKTKLFKYFPLSFGFNLSKSESYESSDLEMTTLSRTDVLTITVNGGTVKDFSLRYQFTPYIYQHATLGATVIAFKVSNLGPGWRTAYPDPFPMLILPYRELSEDPLERTFSRSIEFEEQADGSVMILVEVFNRGFADADIVNVAAYLGEPEFDSDGNPLVPPPDRLIRNLTAARVVALGRSTLRIPWQPLSKPAYVTTVVWGTGRPLSEAEIAWNIYPESALAHVPLPGIADDLV